MTGLAGIGGALFPSRYLIDRLGDDAGAWTSAESMERRRRQFVRWWSEVAATCGPASGLRALFDLIAMPMAGMLGFRARHAVFERRSCRATLETPAGTRLGLVVLPWSDRASGLWRDASDLAHEIGSVWCFVLAPPFLSLVETRGHATRRSADFMWPDALAPASFPAFFTLAHASAFDGVAPDRSRVDTLLTSASTFQDRVRQDLQHGVVEALEAFQAVVRARGPAARFDEALTLIYRILFLLFAESRQLVPRDDPIYRGAYAVGTLCRAAAGDAHAAGLWQGLAAITRLSRLGCRTADLVVNPFNGRLFARAAAPSLEAPSGPRSHRRGSRQDQAARLALVALGSRRGRTSREDINYRDLGVEELGAVYERVLDLHDPSRSSSGHQTVQPHRRSLHSALRKQTGTFYTPRPLAEYLVRRTLEPLVTGRPADAILDLRVVDPAAGSGAFLVAACRYLAEAYERALVEEGRVHSSDIDDGARADFKRLIAERCLAGVDRNPVAIQLARLSLWLTTLAKGKPLGFLDHRLRVGNSIVGASPHDLARAPGKARSQGGLPLFDQAGYEHAVGDAMVPLFRLGAWRDDTVGDVRAKERLWSAMAGARSPLGRWRIAANAWCAHWFWNDGGASAPGAAELRAIMDAVLRGDRVLPTAHLAARLSSIAELSDRLAFFHWPLEFPDVFHDEHGAPKARPGFDAVIGNPPWEMVRDDSGGRTLVRYIRESGIFPACDRGHVNLYQPFLERALSITRPGGRVGLVLPWGLCVDDGTAALRQRLLDHSSIDSLVGVTNGARLFPIHQSLRFSVLVASPGSKTIEFPARFGVKQAAELDDLPAQNATRPTAFPIRLTARNIERIGGRARRIPDVRHASDLRLLERLFDDFPKLGEGPWGARFGRELNATEDRPHFAANGLPVIEGKHLDPFAVRLESVTTRIEPATARRLLPDGRFDRLRLGYRDVSGATNRLSLIAALIPPGVVTTHTVFCLRSRATEDALHFLCGLFNSFVLNAVVRALMGSHVTASQVEDLPVPPWDPQDDRARRIAGLSRALATTPEATATRTVLQAEVARLYRIEIEDFRRVLEGFPLVPKDEREDAARALERLENQV